MCAVYKPLSLVFCYHTRAQSGTETHGSAIPKTPSLGFTPKEDNVSQKRTYFTLVHSQPCQANTQQSLLNQGWRGGQHVA